MRKKFTTRFVNSLEPVGERSEWYDTECVGLCIRVSKGSRVYYLRKRINGKSTRVKLGKAELLSVDEARAGNLLARFFD